jgi:hypothetical protein
MENLLRQRENSNPPQWSRGDLVKVRSKAADTWRNAYVLVQRGTTCCWSYQRESPVPGGTRNTRLSLIAEKEPGAYRGSLEHGSDSAT